MDVSENNYEGQNEPCKMQNTLLQKSTNNNQEAIELSLKWESTTV